MKIIMLLSFVFLSACGFTPLYATNKEKGSYSERYAEISIAGLSDSRNSQLLKSELDDLFHPQEYRPNPKYMLNVSLSSSTGAAVISQNRDISRYTVTMTGQFNLVDIASGKTLYSDHSTLSSSYDAAISEFGTFMGERDAQMRIVKEMARDIKARLLPYILNDKENIGQ